MVVKCGGAVAGDRHEQHVVPAVGSNRTRTDEPVRVREQNDLEQHCRIEGRRAAGVSGVTGAEGGEVEFVDDQMAECELEGAGQHLLREIDRNHLPAVVGHLETRHRRAPWRRWPIITTACKRAMKRVFLQPQRLR